MREPERNGCAERFIRTLKKQLLWVEPFATIEELRQALLAFKDHYNRARLIQRHGHRSPAAVRAAYALGARRMSAGVASSAVPLRFALVSGWERLPPAYVHPDVAAVAVDGQDRVYLFCRGAHPILVYDRDGTLLQVWGAGRFVRPHGITIGPDGAVYCTDQALHTVQKFTPDGQLLLTLGTPGVPSDTGYDGRHLRTVIGPGPPFNQPTNVAVATDGDLYVTDGYGNCRIHHFSPAGELLGSWGVPGTEPGQFHLPHGLAVHPDGRLFVCDMENDRLQIFRPDGTFLAVWPDVQRPTQVVVDQAGYVYVTHHWWRVGEFRYLGGGTVDVPVPGHVSVFDGSGRIVARWGGPDGCAPGNFMAAHGLALDSHGDLYVAEVTWSFAVSKNLAPSDCHTFQKFRRL